MTSLNVLLNDFFFLRREITKKEKLINKFNTINFLVLLCICESVNLNCSFVSKKVGNIFFLCGSYM